MPTPRLLFWSWIGGVILLGLQITMVLNNHADNMREHRYATEARQ